MIEIFDRFGVTLRDALHEAEKIEDDPQLGLFEDERRQSERDLREIRRRIAALDDERQRELEAVDSRYADVRAWEFPAAVVFAIAPQDAREGSGDPMRRRTPTVAELHSDWLTQVETDGPVPRTPGDQGHLAGRRRPARRCR